jgi:hypothetical protein
MMLKHSREKKVYLNTYHLVEKSKTRRKRKRRIVQDDFVRRRQLRQRCNRRLEHRQTIVHDGEHDNGVQTRAPRVHKPRGESLFPTIRTPVCNDVVINIHIHINVNIINVVAAEKYILVGQAQPWR